MDEPRYVDDAFDDRDLSIEGAGLFFPEICRAVFKACGRTRGQFKSDAEISRWNRVDKALKNKSIPQGWITDRLELVKKYRMSFQKATSAILNVGLMEDWKRRTGYYQEDSLEVKDAGEIIIKD